MPLDTGGGIRNAAASLRGTAPAIRSWCSTPTCCPGTTWRAQVDLHGKTDAAVTLHLVEVDDPSRFGVVPTDDSGRVTAFLEKTPNPVTNRINAGCYVFRREVIDQIPAGRRVSVERETFPGLIASGQLVMGYPESAYWLDVGTPRRSCEARATWCSGGCPRPRCPARRACAAARRAPRWRRTRRCPAGRWSARARRSAPGPPSSAACCSTPPTVGEGAVVRDSIVGRGAVVAPGAVLDDAVVGDGAFVGPGNELARGIRIWPGVRLEPTSVRFSSDV